MLQIPMFFCIQETWLMERGISAVLSEPRLAPSEEQKADGMGDSIALISSTMRHESPI